MTRDSLVAINLTIENKLINTPRDNKKGIINPRGTVSGFALK